MVSRHDVFQCDCKSMSDVEISSYIRRWHRNIECFSCNILIQSECFFFFPKVLNQWFCGFWIILFWKISHNWGINVWERVLIFLISASSGSLDGYFSLGETLERVGQELLLEWSFYDHEDCAEKYSNIKWEGIMLDIVGIQSNFFFESIFFPTIYLCHSCDSWFYREYLFITLIIEVYLSRLMGSWTYHGHVSQKNIEKLWEFIKRKFFDETHISESSGIIDNLVKWSLSGIL